MARPDRKLGNDFSESERARLEQLGNGYTPDYVVSEAGFDPMRLEFARWLINHRRLNEDLNPGESLNVAGNGFQAPDTVKGVRQRDFPLSQLGMRGGTPPRRDGGR